VPSAHSQHLAPTTSAQPPNVRCLDRGRLRSRRNGKGDGISHARHGRELDRNKAQSAQPHQQQHQPYLQPHQQGYNVGAAQGFVPVQFTTGRDARVRTVVRIGDLIVALIIDVSGACRRDRVLIMYSSAGAGEMAASPTERAAPFSYAPLETEGLDGVWSWKTDETPASGPW
jgi:hypothetical protein